MAQSLQTGLLPCQTLLPERGSLSKWPHAGQGWHVPRASHGTTTLRETFTWNGPLSTRFVSDLEAPSWALIQKPLSGGMTSLMLGGDLEAVTIPALPRTSGL